MAMAIKVRALPAGAKRVSLSSRQLLLQKHIDECMFSLPILMSMQVSRKSLQFDWSATPPRTLFT